MSVSAPEEPEVIAINGEEDSPPKKVDSPEKKKPKVISAADRMRNLRVEGLPLGILYDKENGETKVRELLSGAFGLPEDAIEGVERVPVMEDGKEVSSSFCALSCVRITV